VGQRSNPVLGQWPETPSPAARCDTARCPGEASNNRRCLAACATCQARPRWITMMIFRGLLRICTE